jgi:Bacterial inner membrane protein
MPESLLEDVTVRWLLGQGFSLMALGLCLAAFADKDDRRLLLLLLLANAAFAVQFGLLGSWVACGVTCVITLRIFLVRTFYRSVLVMSCVLLATLGIAALTWTGLTDAPALVGGMLGTIGMFAFRGSAMRWWLSAGGCCWILSNFLAGSIGGVVAESLILSTNLATIWRIDTDKRKLAPHTHH